MNVDQMLPVCEATTCQTIIHCITSAYGYTYDDLLGRRRQARIAFARQLAMYFCREVAGMSFVAIGAVFARDHGTVIHACRRVRQASRQDRRIKSLVTTLSERITNQTNAK